VARPCPARARAETDFGLPPPPEVGRNAPPRLGPPPIMTASDSLHTASVYINNQLLSRGLLRDGHTIDFTRPGDSATEVAATMGRVIAVVNDLILRRDVGCPSVSSRCPAAAWLLPASGPVGCC